MGAHSETHSWGMNLEIVAHRQIGSCTRPIPCKIGSG